MRKKFDLKILLLIFPYFFMSCVSGKLTEDERYLLIKTDLANSRYSFASNKAREFEKDFPESRYLCELWNIQIAYYKEVNCCNYALKQAEENYKSRCPTVIDQNSSKK